MLSTDTHQAPTIAVLERQDSLQTNYNKLVAEIQGLAPNVVLSTYLNLSLLRKNDPLLKEFQQIFIKHKSSLSKMFIEIELDTLDDNALIDIVNCIKTLPLPTTKNTLQLQTGTNTRWTSHTVERAKVLIGLL